LHVVGENFLSDENHGRAGINFATQLDFIAAHYAAQMRFGEQRTGDRGVPGRGGQQ
jgi:hypothetical protein